MDALAPIAAAHDLSNGDLIALGGVAVALLTVAANEMRGAFKARGNRAALDAVVDLKLQGFTDAMHAMAGEQKALREQYAEHEKECAEFRGEISGDIRRHADAAEKTGRDLDYVKAQVRTLGPRADTFTQMLPQEKP